MDIKPGPTGDLYFTAVLQEGTTVFGNDTLTLTEDSAAYLFGRIDNKLQPVWYYEYRNARQYLPKTPQIEAGNDSLFVAISARDKVNLGNETYELGDYISTILVSFDENGNQGPGKILRAQYEHAVVNLRMDICNDILLGGQFAGEGWFENDTLQAHNHAFRDGLLSKYLRSDGYPIDIGNDTAIGMSHSIELIAPPGYDAYQWSTGETTQMIALKGIEMDTGYHKVWCTAFMGKCQVADTLVLQVYNDLGIGEPFSAALRVFPNPFSNFTTIEYELHHPSIVSFTVFNYLGNIIDSQSEYHSTGTHRMVWEAGTLPPGVYYFILDAGGKKAAEKMMLMD
jgi:hypothetical protein